MYIISACLLGENCKYDGGSNSCQWVRDFAQRHRFVSVCPEVMGKMTTPRPPSEIAGDKVMNCEGLDVTENFKEGAAASMDKAMDAADKAGEQIEGAILKAKSPSCGCGMIYDGTFSETLIPGDGIFTRLLKEHNIKVITEKERIEND